MRKKGEAETEKGPVDLFPAEPTDEGATRRGDLEPWVQGRIGANTKKLGSFMNRVLLC